MNLSCCHIRPFCGQIARMRQPTFTTRVFLFGSQGHYGKGSNCKKHVHTSGKNVLVNLTLRQNIHTVDRASALLRPHSVITPTTCHIRTSGKCLSDSMSSADVKMAIQQLTDQFMEAREMLDDARESLGTVYFSDDMKEAQEAVSATLEQYRGLLSRLSEDQKQEVMRTIGLKMEELRAQEAAIKESLQDDH